MQHWENLCECKLNRHRLLYRYSLAELKDLPLMTDKHDSGNVVQDRNLRRQLSSGDELGALTKKVFIIIFLDCELNVSFLIVVRERCQIFAFGLDAFIILPIRTDKWSTELLSNFFIHGSLCPHFQFCPYYLHIFTDKS